MLNFLTRLFYLVNIDAEFFSIYFVVYSGFFLSALPSRHRRVQLKISLLVLGHFVQLRTQFGGVCRFVGQGIEQGVHSQIFGASKRANKI